MPEFEKWEPGRQVGLVESKVIVGHACCRSQAREGTQGTLLTGWQSFYQIQSWRSKVRRPPS